MKLEATIFDMDGLLIDSEPLWQRAEKRVFGGLGLHLTTADCLQTIGLRIDEVARHWYERHPWEGPSCAEVASGILDTVVSLVREEGEAKPGAASAIEAARRAGSRLALASSSGSRLIEAVLDRLDLTTAFEVCRSAEHETHGKPHPAVFLTTADILGVDPRKCVVFEDSLRGVIAAKAAQMYCIAVPETSLDDLAPFAVADLLLDSLEEVTEETFSKLCRQSSPPGRPA